jgi:hypothetical protein
MITHPKWSRQGRTLNLRMRQESFPEGSSSPLAWPFLITFYLGGCCPF